jgi:hypothetical protein
MTMKSPNLDKKRSPHGSDAGTRRARRFRPGAGRTRRALRGVLVAAALGVLSVAWLAWTARAKAREGLRSAGELMLRYAGAEHIDAPRELVVNGLALHVLSGVSAKPLGTVLDLFEARCKQVGGGFDREIATLLQRQGAAPLPERIMRGGTLREDDEHNGYLACLDLGTDQLGASELIARLQAFAESGDIANVGDLRFVWARRDREQTSYVALWSEGPLPLPVAFPEEGDAPGVDLPSLPRPERSVRLLSAWQRDAAPSLVSYRSETTLDELETSYLRQLASLGLSVRAGDRQDGVRWLRVEAAEQTLLAVLSQDERGRGLVMLTPLH